MIKTLDKDLSPESLKAQCETRLDARELPRIDSGSDSIAYLGDDFRYQLGRWVDAESTFVIAGTDGVRTKHTVKFQAFRLIAHGQTAGDAVNMRNRQLAAQQKAIPFNRS